MSPDVPRLGFLLNVPGMFPGRPSFLLLLGIFVRTALFAELFACEATGVGRDVCEYMLPGERVIVRDSYALFRYDYLVPLQRFFAARSPLGVCNGV